MKFGLENNELSVGINLKGAELSSLKSKKSNLEYLWQADSSYWNRHAPILFPIVGKVKNNSYLVDGNNYSLNQHGFARDMNFEKVEENQNSIKFKLTSNEETKKIYPFDFNLFVVYKIYGSTLEIQYEIENKSKTEMYFSIGAHPGFNIPLKENETLDDYFIEFEKKETLSTYRLEGGLISNKTVDFLNDENTVPLSFELFKGDAIILEDLKSNYLSIKSKLHTHQIKFDFTGFKYLGIWTKPEGAPFVCIEPWHGIADFVHSDGDFKKKTGIIRLEKEATFRCTYKVTVE